MLNLQAVIKVEMKIKSTPRIRAEIGPKSALSSGKWQSGSSPGPSPGPSGGEGEQDKIQTDP